MSLRPGYDKLTRPVIWCRKAFFPLRQKQRNRLWRKDLSESLTAKLTAIKLHAPEGRKLIRWTTSRLCRMDECI